MSTNTLTAKIRELKELTVNGSTTRALYKILPSLSMPDRQILGFIWGLFGVYFYRLGFTFVQARQSSSLQKRLCINVCCTSSQLIKGKKSGSNPATPTTYREVENLIYQGLAAFSFSQILDFGVYCFKKFIFSGFIFIKIS